MRKREIDYGKIVALRKAGWDNRKIADEMEMTHKEYVRAVSDRLGEINDKISAYEREYKQFVSILIEG